MGDPTHRGIYAYGGIPSSTGGTLVTDIRYVDGSAPSLALPNWELLTVDSVIGALSITDGDGVTFDPDYSILELQASVFVMHSYGRYVVFGFGWGDDLPEEIGRVQCNSNELVYAVTRRTISNRVGSVMKLYISSDFEWDTFSWQHAEIIGVGVY